MWFRSNPGTILSWPLFFRASSLRYISFIVCQPKYGLFSAVLNIFVPPGVALDWYKALIMFFSEKGRYSNIHLGWDKNNYGTTVSPCVDQHDFDWYQKFPFDGHTWVWWQPNLCWLHHIQGPQCGSCRHGITALSPSPQRWQIGDHNCSHLKNMGQSHQNH